MAGAKRFHSWELTGSGKVVGLVPVPDGQQPVAYAELRYQRDAVVGVEEHLDGYEQPLVRKFTLDARGRLKASDYVDPSTGLSGQNQYEYDARGYLCARQEVDTGGKLRFRIEMRCDDRSHILEETIKDPAGKVTERHLYEYDAKGRQVKDTLFRGGSSAPTGVYKRNWDDQDRPVVNGYYAPDGSPRKVYRYAWDAQNRRTEISLLDGDEVAFSARFNFDAEGRRTGVEHLDGDGRAFARTTVTEGGGTEVWVAPPSELGPKAAALVNGTSLRELLQLTPAQLNGMAMVAYAHFEQGNLPQARAMYESLSRLDAADPSFPAGVAVTWLAEDDVEQALLWYDRALGRSARHVQSLVGKGELLVRKGQVAEGLELFRAAFAAAPSADDPAIRRARLVAEAIGRAGGKG